MSIPIVMVCAVDPVAREAASSDLLLELPGSVVLRHDLEPGPGESGAVRRRIADLSGVQADEVGQLGHACLSCAVREDVIPSLRWLVESGSWSSIIVALPVASAPAQVAWAIDQALADGELADCHLVSVVCVVDFEQFADDLLADETLADRGMAVGAMDRRSLGEALSAQVEYADVVAGIGRVDDGGLRLARHLVAPVGGLHADWHCYRADVLLARRHDMVKASRRLDPVHVEATGEADADGVWTLELESLRPFHPERLLARIEDLGLGRLRGRGSFWLPSRPWACCVWDGAGGQLFIGQHGLFGEPQQLRTRLVITGDDVAEKYRVRRAFAECLLTDAEWANASRDWATGERARVADGFEPWLGERFGNGIGEVA